MNILRSFRRKNEREKEGLRRGEFREKEEGGRERERKKKK